MTRRRPTSEGPRSRCPRPRGTARRGTGPAGCSRSEAPSAAGRAAPRQGSRSSSGAARWRCSRWPSPCGGGRAGRRQEAPAAKSPLEIGSLLVAICGGVAALLSQFAPGLVSHDHPPPQATMVVRDVNARITLGDFANAVGAQPPPARHRLELGNVVWLKLRLEGSRGRSLALQWGSYEDGDGGALLPGTAHQTDLRVDGDTDVQDVVQPVWVRYPKPKRLRVLFRLLDRAQVQEMARSPAMVAEQRYACGRRA